MKDKIKHYIKALLLEKAHWKQILRDLASSMTNEEMDEILDNISEINKLIKKLEKGL
jgi:hypothetical protein